MLSNVILVDFSVRDYHVKTIENQRELKQALALRRSVFHYEFARKWLSLKSDQDEFDAGADHIAIFDRKAGRIAGVYRLIPSRRAEKFYSNTEFEIGGILGLPGHKVELSRACIHRDYRNGIVINLLWRGIAEYIKASGTDFLFGLSSINTTDPAEIARIHRYFVRMGYADLSHGAAARPGFRIEGFDALASPKVHDEPVEIPSLFKTYLKAGAKICSQPVIDRGFNCADWLTMLDMKTMASAFDRKFMKDSERPRNLSSSLEA
jgi:putative hemolysin